MDKIRYYIASYCGYFLTGLGLILGALCFIPIITAVVLYVIGMDVLNRR